MSLRRKTQLIIVMVLIFLVAAFAIIAQQTLTATFTQFEQATMQGNLVRLRNAVGENAANLSLSNRDYAWWDDAYEFVQDFNEDYITANHGEGTFANLNIDMMLYFDLEQNLTFSQVYGPSLEGHTLDEIEAEIQQFPTLFQMETDQSSVSGLIEMFDQPAVVSMAYVLPSTRDQSPRAYYLFGRILNDERIQSIADLLNFNVALVPLNIIPTLDNSELQTAVDALNGDAAAVFVRDIGEDTVNGYTLISDLSGSPYLLGRITSPRDIFAQGRNLTSIYLALVGAAGLLFALIILILLEVVIVRRLSQLNKGVKQIAQSGTRSGRLPSMGSDELGQLSSSINQMLSSLEQTEVAVSQANARLTAIVGSAPLALWVVDENGVITLFEGKGQETLKINGEQAIGKNFTSVFLPYPQFTDEIRRAMNGETIESSVPLREYIFDTRYTPLGKASPSKRTGVLVVALDVTDRTRAAENVKTMLKDVDVQNQELRRLRSFATSSLAFVQTMVEQKAESKDILEYLKTALSRMEAALNE